jgi:hypothetical protein
MSPNGIPEQRSYFFISGGIQLLAHEESAMALIALNRNNGLATQKEQLKDGKKQ